MDPLPKKLKHQHTKINVYRTLDSDIISTQDSIKLAEEKVKFKLHDSAVKDGGLDMIN